MYIIYKEKELYVTLNSLKAQQIDKALLATQINWNGTVEVGGVKKVILQFQEINGFVQIVKIDRGVQTPQPVVLERLNDFLRAHRQTEHFGIEDTEIAEDTEPVPYDPDKINIRRDTFPIFQIFKMMEDGDVNLNPDFQRNLVWDNTRKSRLIESVLLGIPLPVFYFAENRDGTFNVVDGLQRLSTLRQFMKNDFRLRNLEYLKVDCETKYFKVDNEKKITAEKTIDKKYNRRIEQAQLVVNIIEAKSPSKVKYDIFKRINEGGRPLNNQEIRNCMASSDTRKYLKEMAKSRHFINATGESVNDIRMDAQELVLRFTAFYLQSQGLIEPYTGNMNVFLDAALDCLNEKKTDDFINLSTLFQTAMQNSYYLFDKYCFRKCLLEHLLPNSARQLINKSLFTTWSISLCKYKMEDLERSVERGAFAPILATEFAKLGEYYEVVTIRTTDRKSLELAFKYTRNILHKHLPSIYDTKL